MKHRTVMDRIPPLAGFDQGPRDPRPGVFYNHNRSIMWMLPVL